MISEGDVVLTPLPQANGATKNRPAVVLRKMPPFSDLLVCGISSQIHQAVPGFDDVIDTTDPGFVASGLKVASVFRIGFLAVLPANRFVGTLGAISPERLKLLRTRLSDHLRP